MSVKPRVPHRPVLRLWVAAGTQPAAEGTAEHVRSVEPSVGHAWPTVIEAAWEDARRGRLRQAIARMVRGTCAAAVRDDAASGQLWSVAAARLLLTAGRLREARAAARCSLHMVERTAAPDLAGFAAYDVLARVALSTGDPAGLTEAALSVTRMGASPLADVAAAGAWLDLLLQDARSSELAEPAAPARTTHPPARPTTWFGAAPDVWHGRSCGPATVRRRRNSCRRRSTSTPGNRTTPMRPPPTTPWRAWSAVIGGRRCVRRRCSSGRVGRSRQRPLSRTPPWHPDPGVRPGLPRCWGPPSSATTGRTPWPTCSVRTLPSASSTSRAAALAGHACARCSGDPCAVQPRCPVGRDHRSTGLAR
jgi:hypothetical protein